MSQTTTEKQSNNSNTENIRFTTLINPYLLSQIKLISYISNQKLYTLINQSIQHYISHYNSTNNTNIENLINLQQQNSTTQTTPLNPKTK
jgi:hypothetical protein